MMKGREAASFHEAAWCVSASQISMVKWSRHYGKGTTSMLFTRCPGVSISPLECTAEPLPFLRKCTII